MNWYLVGLVVLVALAAYLYLKSKAKKGSAPTDPGKKGEHGKH